MKTAVPTFDQIIALAIIVGCMILIGFGLDGEIKGILGVGAGYAFGTTRGRIAGGKNDAV